MSASFWTLLQSSYARILAIFSHFLGHVYRFFVHRQISAKDMRVVKKAQRFTRKRGERVYLLAKDFVARELTNRSKQSSG